MKIIDIKVIVLYCLIVNFEAVLAVPPAYDVIAGMVEAGASVGAILMGQPMAVAGVIDGGMRATNGAMGMLYESLQEGKQQLKESGRKARWDKTKKKKANEVYKAIWSNIHRPGSPDVFPEAYE